jgi:hypothetical protein
MFQQAGLLCTIEVSSSELDAIDVRDRPRGTGDPLPMPDSDILASEARRRSYGKIVARIARLDARCRDTGDDACHLVLFWRRILAVSDADAEIDDGHRQEIAS